MSSPGFTNRDITRFEIPYTASNTVHGNGVSLWEERTWPCVSTCGKMCDQTATEV